MLLKLLYTTETSRVFTKILFHSRPVRTLCVLCYLGRVNSWKHLEVVNALFTHFSIIFSYSSQQPNTRFRVEKYWIPQKTSKILFEEVGS